MVLRKLDELDEVGILLTFQKVSCLIYLDVASQPNPTQRPDQKGLGNINVSKPE